MTASTPPQVLVVGGGLAGIAAATACRRAGLNVTLLESRKQLGGRSTSYVDRTTGEVIDNCQHVTMGCCTQLKQLCESLGIADSFETVESLSFVAPDGRITRFAANRLPAPMHLIGAFLGLPYLSLAEKWRFARAVQKLAKASSEQLRGRNLRDWLLEQGQTENLIRNAWEVVLISALSESIDRIDAAYARKVFVDGFLAHRDGWRVEIPMIPLDELYSRRAMTSLEQQGIEIRLNHAVESLTCDHGTLTGVLLRDGTQLLADDVVCAVPQLQVGKLLADLPELRETVAAADAIESAPITSVHLWFDRPICPLPHAVLVGRLGHWLFDRGERNIAGRPVRYYQIVMSASRSLDGLPAEEVLRRIVSELGDIWPAGASATLINSRVITERRAVFSAVPGIDRLRPTQQTPIANLQLAGDWTQTGWPATMEGAVRSGYLAARNILRRHGISQPPVAPDLPVSFWARLLLGIRTSESSEPS